MNISKEECKQAEGYLKRFNYNCTNIVNIRTDIIGIRSYIINGMPKTSYRISDTVFDSVVKLEENKQLQNSFKLLQGDAMRKNPRIISIRDSYKDLFK